MTDQEPAATCRLCQPAEEMPAATVPDHLRLFHPGWDEGATPVTDVTAPFERPVITAAMLEPHGCCCTVCGREFAAGDPYAEQPLAFIGDTPAVEIVCLACEIPEPGGDG